MHIVRVKKCPVCSFMPIENKHFDIIKDIMKSYFFTIYKIEAMIAVKSLLKSFIPS